MSVRLIASLGAPPGGYREAAYAHQSKTWVSRFAPVAVARLLGLRGPATLLATAKAHGENGDALEEELRAAGLAPEWVEVGEGRDEDEMLEAVARLGEAVPEGSAVALDVTLGLRHLPFTYLAALAFLTGLRQVRVAGIWYGAYELKGPDGTVPLVDATGLFQLLRWYQAVEALSQLGDLRPVARLLRGESRVRGELVRAAHATTELAAALASGLPLEAGLAAHQLSARLEAARGAQSPLVKPVLDEVRRIVGSLATEAGDKRRLALDRGELDRQLRVIEHLCPPRAPAGDANAPAAAVASTMTCLWEWLQNFLLWHDRAENWLDRAARVRWEAALKGSESPRRGGGAAAADPSPFGLCGSEALRLAPRIRTHRHLLAHAGMSGRPVEVQAGSCASLVRQARALFQACLHPDGRDKADPCPSVPPSPPVNRRLLVTPLGLSPGVLFSAVRHVEPATALIATSAQAMALVEPSLSAAGQPGLAYHCLVLDDPFLGFEQARAWVQDDVLEAVLADADEVIVNLTGGTTALQYAAERIAEHARDRGLPVRRVAVIDRRAVEDQRRDPYVLGEVVAVDSSRA